MPEKNPYLPATITLQPEKMITLVFNHYWYQEDIQLLSELIFQTLTTVNVNSSVVGADREDIHFHWQGIFYILYFESYSQSCWIEAELVDEGESLSKVFDLLVPALS